MSLDPESLYKKFFPMVYRRCQFLVKDEELAADLAQDVFVRVIQRTAVLYGDQSSSLLYRIATNVSLNAIRSRKRARIAGDPDMLEMIACGSEFEEVSIARTVLDSLFSTYSEGLAEPVPKLRSTEAYQAYPERASTRTIAVLHYVDGLTLAETAEICGLSVSGVRKRLRTLREKSRELFP